MGLPASSSARLAANAVASAAQRPATGSRNSARVAQVSVGRARG